VEEQAVQGGPDVAGELGGAGGGDGVGQDDGREIAAEKEGQAETRGAPEAFPGEDEGQGQGRPEEAEVIGVRQPGEEVVDGLEHLVGIKALDVVGADLDLLLDDEQAPGEVTQD